MPYQVEFVAGGTGIHLTGAGTVLGSEVVAGAFEAHRDEARARGLRYGLVDLTELTVLRITTEEIRQVVAEDRITAALAPGVFVAVIAPRDYVFGMARMWQAFAEVTGWQTAVFRDRADAIEWLKAGRVWPE